jgi:hypothetical protein
MSAKKFNSNYINLIHSPTNNFQISFLSNNKLVGISLKYVSNFTKTLHDEKNPKQIKFMMNLAKEKQASSKIDKMGQRLPTYSISCTYLASTSLELDR